MQKTIKFSQKFDLENGESLPEIDIAYQTWGTLNADRSNVIWAFHAFTGNSDALDWWSGLLGDGKLFDPKDWFIVCANFLGSSYGSTSPMSINPTTGRIYGQNFPLISIRDMVNAHILLADYLGIDKINLALGGSMGGQQALEWAIAQPNRIDQLALIACGAKMSPWAIALNEAQRMAIRATLPPPPVFDEKTPTEIAQILSETQGIEAARAIGMASYRSYASYQIRQKEDSDDKMTDFRAASYQRYQGEKLRKRFNPLSYISIANSMDSHNVARGRGSVREALGQVRAKTLVVGIDSDGLFPTEEQAFLAAHIGGARFVVIESAFGHDGFLVEFEQMKRALQKFLHQPKLVAAA